VAPDSYVDDNYAAVQTELDSNMAELLTLARNSITSSFLPDARKAVLCATIPEGAQTAACEIGDETPSITVHGRDRPIGD
jgi:adenosine deaminase